MTARFFLLSIFFSIFSTHASAQNQFEIEFPYGNERGIACQVFEQAFQNKPKETSFVIKRESNKLFFETNDPKWFKQLFKKSKDGIAVDIVSKDRYACETSVEPSQIKGKLLKPVYAGDLKRGLKPHEQNRYRVEVGTIPISMLKSDLEFNILFLNNNKLCKYYTIYNLESYPWGLLDMGVYLDSITYKNDKIVTQNEQAVTRYKTLQFIIPFEKNKSVYDSSDIKPLYDSLRLTDFNIKTIDIKAYASVEGSKQRNMELQQERGSSIAASLQSFQSPEIETNITTSENWVEFFNDVKNTSYATLTSKSKEQIKAALTGSTANELEPILAQHRKAVVTMELDKIDVYKNKSINELTSLFNTSIATDELDEARIIQNSLLEKIRIAASPESLEGIEVPNQKKYIDFMNKNLMYDYLIDVRKSLIVYNKLQELEKQDPKNKRIQYNLAVLKFILWRNNALDVKPQDFKKEIKSLTNYGINPSLVDRMMINYHIVNAEREMRKRNYNEKDKSVLNILSTYNRVPLTDQDYLSLAQFLTYYAQNMEAVKLLAPRVQEITIDEDLLFYYLNLTLIDKRLTQTNAYRTILLNASNLNQERFCKLFNPSLEGGVTFQLLEDGYLKNSYCENCVN
ncbi:hypothetical protein [Nonlabens ponticola]|uniref:DUF3857 domain-containing protein n=1 Tax=Nonlabens ponticola TaxID=2496866 RepID=A0A3S9MZR8_9FLAO|nr:hypothetical protein [Nonlabens ponticola]AZQ44582.1 hypothetical protein EJ995_10125 [Nonlabens ponticola]